MLERLPDERLAGMLTTATEGNRYANAKVEVTAADLLALVSEVSDHRADARAGATAFTNFHDWLAEWGKTEAAARAVWKGWYDGMSRQHRFVDRHRSKWDILDPEDKLLDAMIAQTVITTALDSIGNGEGEHGS